MPPHLALPQPLSRGHGYQMGMQWHTGRRHRPSQTLRRTSSGFTLTRPVVRAYFLPGTSRPMVTAPRIFSRHATPTGFAVRRATRAESGPGRSTTSDGEGRLAPHASRPTRRLSLATTLSLRTDPAPRLLGPLQTSIGHGSFASYGPGRERSYLHTALPEIATRRLWRSAGAWTR